MKINQVTKEAHNLKQQAAIAIAKKNSVSEEDKNPGEYDMEGDFVKNQIHTIVRVMTHLEKAIDDNENLPEWVQMKISQAQGMLVGVMDYMISQKERDHEQEFNEESLKEDWQKVNKRDKTDGMSRKAVKAYRREHPGSKLKTAVTTKPSKLKKGSKSAKRRKSFCARMSGMKKAHASAKTKRDPNSPINKALRRWNCESVEQLQELMLIAEQKIKSLRESTHNEKSKYLQGAKDIIKGADPEHIARVRNLDPETLTKYVKVVWEKINSKEYNYRKPDLSEMDTKKDDLIGGLYTPEEWDEMVLRLKRKAKEQERIKQQQNKPQQPDELSKIVKLSGNNK